MFCLGHLSDTLQPASLLLSDGKVQQTFFSSSVPTVEGVGYSMAEMVRSLHRYWRLAHIFLRDTVTPATECHRAVQQCRYRCSIVPPESCHWSSISCLEGGQLTVAHGFPEMVTLAYPKPLGYSYSLWWGLNISFPLPAPLIFLFYLRQSFLK